MGIIIVGAGEIGYHIARKLTGERHDVTLIEADRHRLAQIRDQLDAQFLEGNGASPALLKAAGIDAAEMVIAVSDQDEVNLMACLMAHLASSEPVKIARVRNPDYAGHEYRVGGEGFEFVNLFINPEYEAAARIARILSTPGAVDYVEFAEGHIKFIGFKVPENSSLDGMKLLDFGSLAREERPLIATIVRKGRVRIPSGADTILAGDVLYFVTTDEQLPRLQNLLDVKRRSLREVMIYGASATGFYLAQMLEKMDVGVKLIDPDPDRCAQMAERLSKTTVLCGEGMDVDLLGQENIARMDAFVALTKDEEDNVLSTLLAKSKGVRMGVSLTNRSDYAKLVSEIGIDVAISPQLAAVSRILQHLRKGKVLSVEELRPGAEGIEFEALETSDAIGVPLKDLGLPRGALVVAILRNGDVLIPGGFDDIHPGDRVVIFATGQTIRKVEKLFSVKLEYY